MDSRLIQVQPDFYRENRQADWLDVNDEAEKVQHESAIEALGEQFPEFRRVIRPMYLQALHELSPQARIRAFISIFVIREIKGKLLHMKQGAH
ncbi:hypothetical protein DESUT3_38830 [Desulfuromonas versatilis]|uniref:Uncharacterized protein n=2 Tax=Desulfuromonas versatilis TaxID=2802975 RepID=A0ABM8HV72_9BACT|nr:hypothetical protein DESUT3_38830 [Desulfuromonas versatilis]